MTTITFSNKNDNNGDAANACGYYKSQGKPDQWIVEFAWENRNNNPNVRVSSIKVAFQFSPAKQIEYNSNSPALHGSTPGDVIKALQNLY